VLGDKGSAIIERERLRHLHLARDDSQEVGPYGLQLEESAEEDGPQAQEGTHAMQIADMIRAIREDGTPLVDGHAARKPVQIILAVYESARTGQEVQLS
jgi:predicted dehydrogenase